MIFYKVIVKKKWRGYGQFFPSFAHFHSIRKQSGCKRTVEEMSYRWVDHTGAGDQTHVRHYRSKVLGLILQLLNILQCFGSFCFVCLFLFVSKVSFMHELITFKLFLLQVNFRYIATAFFSIRKIHLGTGSKRLTRTILETWTPHTHTEYCVSRRLLYHTVFVHSSAHSEKHLGSWTLNED